MMRVPGMPAVLAKARVRDELDARPNPCIGALPRFIKHVHAVLARAPLEMFVIPERAKWERVELRIGRRRPCAFPEVHDWPWRHKRTPQHLGEQYAVLDNGLLVSQAACKHALELSIRRRLGVGFRGPVWRLHGRRQHDKRGQVIGHEVCLGEIQRWYD